MRQECPEEAGAPMKGRRLRAWRGRRRAASPETGSLREALLALLENMGGTPERAGLQSLWDNWEKALGTELASLAQPLGSHAARKGGANDAGQGVTLLLAAEDAMLLQELRFRGGEILERVNGFLGKAYFCDVKISLPLGRSAPVRTRAPARPAACADTGRAPVASGVFLAGMDDASPVARCYARFAGRAEAAGQKPCAEHEEKSEK